MRFPDRAWCFEHVRESGDGFAGLLDGLDCICRAVELGLNGFLDAVEHLRKAEQVVLGFVKLFINVAECDEVRCLPFQGNLDFFG